MRDLEEAREVLHRLTLRTEAEVGDGTLFFETMDSLLSAPGWLDLQRERYAALGVPSRVAVSGRWGQVMAARHPVLAPLVLPGGLRHDDLPPIEEDLTGAVFVFLDDSCYLGRTRDKIRARVEEAGGSLVASLVLYDGSARGIKGMEGLYRYHDDH